MWKIDHYLPDLHEIKLQKMNLRTIKITLAKLILFKSVSQIMKFSQCAACISRLSYSKTTLSYMSTFFIISGKKLTIFNMEFIKSNQVLLSSGTSDIIL